MFYHEHAFGITRLNPYVGIAAGYVITDQWEQDLITRSVIPPFLDQIPLVIQDRTFVDAAPTTKFIYNPATGLFDTPIIVPKVRVTDPLWNWGSLAPVGGVVPPVTGDLWTPHVYMPAQNQVAGSGGVNPFGRWMYGPWFYPATVVSKGPVANPYYDPRCSSPDPFVFADCETPGQPTQIPGTPNVSMGMEAFQDSAVVNGTVFPTMTVDPRAYRFRILNAANDRFWNLSFYKADPAQVSPDLRPASRLTEVKTVPASAATAAANNWPSNWPVDGRDGGVPDPGLCTGTEPNLVCPNLGPSFLQIGTESGFLPQPVEINPQPITYNTDPTAFWVGNVDKMGLALGPAERADVIVDFSQYANQTLILYNDAPAAWPARVAGYDYYTGAPDQRDSGGYGTGGAWDAVTGSWVNGTGPLVGYAPNTRTVMQVIVRPTVVGTPYNFSRPALEAEFTAAAPVTQINPAPAKTLFERAQEPIIVGQAAYSTTYPNSYFPPNFPWEGIAQINDQALNFVTLAGQQVSVPTEPKGIHDEMGASFDPVYGRMSGNLGMQLPNPTTLNALLVLYGFNDLPTEYINNSPTVNVQVLPGLPGQPGTVTDGTQIWKISHNGVDTHPIHFHVFDVQLINRVGWDGQILLPEPNELGWKETIKISPLEDTIVAVRMRVPALPFGIPDSLRPLNPAIPIDSQMGFGAPIPTGSDWPIPGSTTGSGFSSIDWQTGNAYVGTEVPPYPYPNYKGVVTNVLYNFGWEYVWHCHILSHEEMDMMRPVVLNYDVMLPPAFAATKTGSGSSTVVAWNDPTPIDYNALNTYGNPANEIGFNVWRSTNGTTFSKLNATNLLANSTSYSDTTAASGTAYVYKVEAFNAKGSTFSTLGSSLAVTVVATNGPAFTAPATVNLQATVALPLPGGLTITQVAFYNGTTQIGLAPTPGATSNFSWTNVPAGSYSVTAWVTDSLGGVAVSAPITVTVTGTLAADFTATGSAAGTDIGFCETVTLASTSTGTVTGYSWMVNGVNYLTSTVNVTLPVGTWPVTLAVINSATGETAQITKNVIIVNHNPTAIPGGPYIVSAGGTMTLAGSGTDLQDACNTAPLTYAWNVDNVGGYDYFTANPAVPYSLLLSVVGGGPRTMTLQVTDSNGGVGTATTRVMVIVEAAVRMNGIIYPTLQSAYNAAVNGSVIELTAGVASGGLVTGIIPPIKTVTISGGFGAGFTPATGVTVIRNPVNLQQGKVMLRNISVMP
jgi:FtsP/CotA-like multicopper oxidase with cupredoxin domain